MLATGNQLLPLGNRLPESNVEAMPSKIILMMPKNQESNKFQKSRIIKIKIQVKNQDSRFKNQEKTQSR